MDNIVVTSSHSSNTHKPTPLKNQGILEKIDELDRNLVNAINSQIAPTAPNPTTNTSCTFGRVAILVVLGKYVLD